MARAAAARPGQRRDPEPSEAAALSAPTKAPCWRWGGAKTASTVPAWHHTHHFPSLFDQGEHAQDVGLLRSPAHPARGPGTLSSVPRPRPHLQAQARPHIWAGTENPVQIERESEREGGRTEELGQVQALS